MPFFVYKARNQNYDITKGYLYVDRKSDVYNVLKEKNLQLINASTPLFCSLHFQSKELIYRTLKDWFLSLSQLLESGIPLFESLKMLANQTDSLALKKVLFHIIYEIEKGESFSKACQKYKDVFGVVAIQKIIVAENSGDFISTFKDLYMYFDWRLSVKQNVMNALRYPVFLLLFLMLLIFALNIYLLPEITNLLKNHNIESPAFRYWIAFKDYFLYILAACIALIFSGDFCYKKNMIPHNLLKKIYYLPFGKLAFELQLARFLQTFGFVQNSQIDIKTAFSLAKDEVTLLFLKNDLEKMEEQIIKGEKTSSVIKNISFIDPMIVRFLELGEETGTLEKNLILCARILHNRFYSKLERIVQILQPGFIVFMGLLMLWIVSVFILPIYECMQEGVG